MNLLEVYRMERLICLLWRRTAASPQWVAGRPDWQRPPMLRFSAGSRSADRLAWLRILSPTTRAPEALSLDIPFRSTLGSRHARSQTMSLPETASCWSGSWRRTRACPLRVFRSFTEPRQLTEVDGWDLNSSDIGV
jgi:hypothetical protein